MSLLYSPLHWLRIKATFLFPPNSVRIFHWASVDKEGQDFGWPQEDALGLEPVILTEEGEQENLENSLPESMKAGWPTIILCVLNSSCLITSQSISLQPVCICPLESHVAGPSCPRGPVLPPPGTRRW